MCEDVNVYRKEYFMKLPSMDLFSRVWFGSVSTFSLKTCKSGGTVSRNKLKLLGLLCLLFQVVMNRYYDRKF